MRAALAVMFTVLGFGLASAASPDPPGPQRVTHVNGDWPLEEFTLLDQHSRPFTREQLLGRWTLVLFGDTHCDQSCTAVLSALTGMYQRIAQTQKVKTTQVVFISLAEDTPETLRQYLAPFDERFIGATGPPQTVMRLADDLGVADALPKSSGDPGASARDYPGTLSLVDPEGIVWGQFLPPFDVMSLTARYLKTRVGR
ncbi:MAG TPA: SCO family protein [Burkholderiales bacterium]|nr:SCO family protein [Burkholderiales bacterium]